ncbi:porin [Pseudorhodoferax sp. Leaf267]|uniref:porin n=1 Tax=Pseudorhodoferax sp. Leaf267 TaxID=1736316 RepID=UPI0006FEB0C5|nr:porin [Pseudorhodoferax sp. Leaf267]KQP13123.1 porin [Pseudorhodoferax sp. Leaf267]
MPTALRSLPIALGTLCALAAGSAQAQSSVRLYGIVDLSVRRANGLNEFAPSPTSATVMSSGLNNTSRWGLRIQEDLGGGLSAQAQLESGINAKTGAPASSTIYFDRQSWVGLGSAWGLVSLGRQTTLLADAVSPIDPLGMRLASFNPSINTAALSQHQLGVGFGASGSATGSYRLNNSIKYSGEFAGVSVKLMHSLGEVATNSDAANSTGVGLGYKLGALQLSAAHQSFRNNDDTLGLRGVVLGAAWVFDGGARLAGIYGRSRAETSATARTAQRTLGLGATVPATGLVDVTLAHYRVARERSARAGDGYGRTVAFAEYKLSKRSVAYAEADHTRWQGGFQGAANKQKATGVSAGIRHSF